ncbi:MAG: ketoacyl-ACP synthase III [Candidatus Gracilibacteria bacterium]|nr:ketoacyl-ACP synthase III [Candidatus Gracilibacteria bacterium]
MKYGYLSFIFGFYSMNTIINSTATYIPKNKISSQEMEQRISEIFPEISFGILEEMTGIKTRYFVSEGEYSSDLAIKASEKCFEKSEIKKQDIDLLIFASASQDIIEPATGNIVQKGLGLTCPIFDVKNACNSFLNGIDIADSFIKSGKYKNILVCSGETPSKVIQYKIFNRLDLKKYFAGFTLGDAGTAMILTVTKENIGIKKTYFLSDGNSWELGTIMGGGSRFPHIDKNYFTGEPAKLKDKFKSIGTKEFENGLSELGWKKNEITKFLFIKGQGVILNICKILFE